MQIKLDKSFTKEEVWALDLNKVIGIMTGKMKYKGSVRSKITLEPVNWLKVPYFRIFFWDDELWLHFLVKTAGDWMGLVFKYLVETNIKRWLSEQEAVRKSSDTLMDFFNASQEATDNWDFPFRVVISKRAR